MRNMINALVAATTALYVDAKVIKTADGRKTLVEQPTVKLGKDDDLCLFKNFDDQWCISATPPMVKAGWAWAQTYTTTPITETPVLDYYQIEF